MTILDDHRYSIYLKSVLDFDHVCGHTSLINTYSFFSRLNYLFFVVI